MLRHSFLKNRLFCKTERGVKKFFFTEFIDILVVQKFLSSSFQPLPPLLYSSFLLHLFHSSNSFTSFILCPKWSYIVIHSKSLPVNFPVLKVKSVKVLSCVLCVVAVGVLLSSKWSLAQKFQHTPFKTVK